jgi:hypothetical protein
LYQVKVDQVLEMKPGPERTAALVAWLQSRFETADVPVLVGGAAVELYTGGAHTTGDLDFVGRVPASVVRQLETAGFERHGRHWIHDRAQLFLEFPGRDLGEGVLPIWTRLRGHRVRMISIEDLLVDRLAAWKHWKSSVDGVNAFRLFRAQQRRIDPSRLTQRAKAEDASDALRSLRTFVSRWKGRAPTAEALDTWANSTR